MLLLRLFYDGARNVLFRVFGSITTRWRGHKYLLIRIDFKKTDWSPDSDWLISYESVVDYYASVAGSSVFPANEQTKPTSMTIALTTRLIGHILKGFNKGNKIS